MLETDRLSRNLISCVTIDNRDHRVIVIRDRCFKLATWYWSSSPGTQFHRVPNQRLMELELRARLELQIAAREL
jgi:hypothetical protein